MSNARIPVLWFTASGAGPNEMALEVYAFRPDLTPPSVGLRVHETPGGMIIGDTQGAMVGGGFYMERPQAAELHRQLGEWLATGPSRATADVAAERLEARLQEIEIDSLAREVRRREVAEKALASARERPFEFLHGLGYRAAGASITIEAKPGKYDPLGSWVLVRDNTQPPPGGGHVEQPTDVLHGAIVATGPYAGSGSPSFPHQVALAEGTVVAFRRSDAIEIDKDRSSGSSGKPWPSLFVVHHDNLLTVVRS